MVQVRIMPIIIRMSVLVLYPKKLRSVGAQILAGFDASNNIQSGEYSMDSGVDGSGYEWASS